MNMIEVFCFVINAVTQICGAYPLVPFSEVDILDKVHVYHALALSIILPHTLSLHHICRPSTPTAVS